VLNFLALYGFMGVELFFMISGFVICMSAWDRPLSEFFTSRVARLFPAYVAAVLITATVARLMLPPGDPGRPDQDTIIANLTMLQSFLGLPNVDTVYWTLAVELKFYLLFAIVVWRGLTYRRVVAFALAWLALSSILTIAEPGVLATLVETQYAACFVAGIAFYLLYRFGPNLLLVGLIAASWLIAMQKNSHRTLPWQHTLLSPVTEKLIITGFFLVMGAIALGYANWIRGRWLVIAGALTYPLYLVHRLIGLIMIDRLGGRLQHWAVLPTTVATVIALAWLVHLVVERPLGRRLRRGLLASFAAVRGPGSADAAAGADLRLRQGEREAAGLAPHLEAALARSQFDQVAHAEAGQHLLRGGQRWAGDHVGGPGQAVGHAGGERAP
jgi:peptidoglycan/LPS O-acetylase OafA/YrhL